MSSPPIKIAIIGVGLIGPRHAQTVAKNPNTVLSGIVDPYSSSSLATELGTNHYKTISSLLSSSDKPDAAIICTPNHTHAPLSKELVTAGIHLLIEKPISNSITSARDLLHHTSSIPNLKILVGHHRRFNPYIISTKSTITSGTLGEIIAINGTWTIQKPASYFDPPTEWRRSSSSGGVVLINLIHEIDLLHYLIGPISRIHAEKMRSRRNFEAEEGAAITIKFKSGAVGTFLIGDNLPSPYSFEGGTGENPMIPRTRGEFYRIFGTEGTLSCPDMMRWSYDGCGEKGWKEVMEKEKIGVEEGRVPFEGQLEHFVEVVRGTEEPSCSGEAALAALIVCDAVKRAIESGETVNLENYHLRNIDLSFLLSQETVQCPNFHEPTAQYSGDESPYVYSTLRISSR